MPSGGTRRVPGERRPQSCYHCRTPPTGVDDIESSGRKLAAAWLRKLATVLFVAAVPVFLIAGSVRMVINAPALYSYGFDRYDIPAYTGIEREDLLEVAARIRAYFNDDSEYLIVPTTMRGVDVPSLYNEREILHMRDVKGLVRGVYAVHEATGLYLLAFGAFGLALNRRPFLARLARYAGYGGGLTLGIVLLAGVGSLAGFDRLFLAFHLVSFANDLWQLDPRRDFLIAMFPQAFFFDATMLIAISASVQALVLVAIAAALPRWWRPRASGAKQASGHERSAGA